MFDIHSVSNTYSSNVLLRIMSSYFYFYLLLVLSTNSYLLHKGPHKLTQNEHKSRRAQEGQTCSKTKRVNSCYPYLWILKWSQSWIVRTARSSFLSQDELISLKSPSMQYSDNRIMCVLVNVNYVQLVATLFFSVTMK